MTDLRRTVMGFVPDVLLLVASAIAFWQLGFDSWLIRDDGFYFYAGRQFADGVAPYVSGFDHKGPGAAMIFGSIIALARKAGVDELAAARGGMLVLSSLIVVGTFRIALRLTGAKDVSLLAAACVTAIAALGTAGVGGPDPSVLMLFFCTWSLVFAGRGNYFLAAAMGSVAGVVWQPLMVYAALPVLLASLGDGTTRARSIGALRAAAGGALPVGAVMAWFASVGALPQFIEGTVGFNLQHLERGSSPFMNIWWMTRGIILGFPEVAAFVLIGLVAFVVIVWGAVRAQGLREFARGNPWRALALSLPAPVGWSLLDFQTAVDFFVFLPYAFAGFAWVLLRAKEAFKAGAPRVVSPVAIAGAFAAIMLLSGSMYRLRANTGLATQARAAADIEAQRDSIGPILAVNAPEFLTLTGRKSSVRFLVLVPSGGLGSLINATYPNGFAGLIEEIERDRPQTIVANFIDGKGIDPVQQWIDKEFSLVRETPWRVYVRKSSSTP